MLEAEALDMGLCLGLPPRAESVVDDQERVLERRARVDLRGLRDNVIDDVCDAGGVLHPEISTA
jgi:hypothetical protein